LNRRLQRPYPAGAQLYVRVATLATPVGAPGAQQIVTTQTVAPGKIGFAELAPGTSLLVIGTHMDSGLRILSSTPVAHGYRTIFDTRTLPKNPHAAGERIGTWVSQYAAPDSYTHDVLAWARTMYGLIKRAAPGSGVSMNFGPVDVSQPEWFFDLVPYLDIDFMEEGFIGRSQPVLTGAAWTRQVLACEYLARLGKAFILEEPIGGPVSDFGKPVGSPDIKGRGPRSGITRAEMNWALANYLLVKTAHTYTHVEPRGDAYGILNYIPAKLFDRPEYHVSIGHARRSLLPLHLAASAAVGARSATITHLPPWSRHHLIALPTAGATPQLAAISEISNKNRSRITLSAPLRNGQNSGGEVDVLPIYTYQGAFARDFTGGIVFVNPSPLKRVVITLPHAYRDLYRHLLRRVTLLPGSGIVLLAR
jgi:hypothetical protein